MDKKWIDIKVERELYEKVVGDLVNAKKRTKKSIAGYKNLPYLEVIVTGEAPEKKYEDFAKVEFPALCLYGWGGEKVLGCINCAYINEELTYELHDMSKQHDEINRQSGFSSLEALNGRYNIEIVKAKIIAKRG